MAIPRTIAAASMLVMMACGGGLASAKSDFRNGHVADAKAQLLALEAESVGWSGTRRAEYTLYRGLVHLALGDREAAAAWLREAMALEDAHPRTLSEDDRVRMRLALESAAVEPIAPAP